MIGLSHVLYQDYVRFLHSFESLFNCLLQYSVLGYELECYLSESVIVAKLFSCSSIINSFC
jgi:hypothetical protein